MPRRKIASRNRTRSPRVMLAEELERLRSESGRSLRELAEKVGWDHAHLHNLERGKSLGGPELIEALDMVYGTTPMLMRLWELAKDGVPFREKYQRYMQLEAEATVIEGHDEQTIPGLLQTEEYARALLWSVPHTPDDERYLEEQLAGRLSRQELLRRSPAPRYRAIISEAALRRPLPDAAAWQQQLARLTEVAPLPHVTVQVLPFAAGMHGLLGGTSVFLRLPSMRSVAWLEGSQTGELEEDGEEVERLRLSYDAARDLALSPRESVAFLERLMEDSAPCDPPVST